MSLIALTCPNCGSKLDVEDGKEFYYCSYCGTKVTHDKQKIELSGNVNVSGIATKETLLDKAFIQLRNREYKDADSTFQRVLDIDPRCPKAYIGRLLASLERDSMDSLVYCDRPLSKFVLFERALEFSSGEEKQQYLDLEQRCLRRIKEGIALPACPEQVDEPNFGKYLLRCLMKGVPTSLIGSLILSLFMGADAFSGISSIFFFLLAVTTVMNAIKFNDEYYQWKLKYKYYLEEKQKYDAIVADPEGYKDSVVRGM